MSRSSYIDCIGKAFHQSVSALEHKTCDILAAERLRLMRFDNRLIIDSFLYVYSNGNFGRAFHYPTLS